MQQSINTRGPPVFPLLLTAREVRLSAESEDVPVWTGPVSPRASVHGVNAVVCPDIIAGIPVDVKTGETAVVLFRA